MTQPQEFLQPPSGLSLGQVPEAARGPSQGDWGDAPGVLAIPEWWARTT